MERRVPRVRSRGCKNSRTVGAPGSGSEAAVAVRTVKEVEEEEVEVVVEAVAAAEAAVAAEEEEEEARNHSKTEELTTCGQSGRNRGGCVTSWSLQSGARTFGASTA